LSRKQITTRTESTEDITQQRAYNKMHIAKIVKQEKSGSQFFNRSKKLFSDLAAK